MFNVLRIDLPRKMLIGNIVNEILRLIDCAGNQEQHLPVVLLGDQEIIFDKFKLNIEHDDNLLKDKTKKRLHLGVYSYYSQDKYQLE